MRRAAFLSFIALSIVSAHATDYKAALKGVVVKAIRGSPSGTIAGNHFLQRLQQIDQGPGLDKWLVENPDALDFLSQAFHLPGRTIGSINKGTRALGNGALKKAVDDAVRDAQQIAEQARARNDPEELQRLRKRHIYLYLPESELRAFFMPDASAEATQTSSNHFFDGRDSQGTSPVVVAPAIPIANENPFQQSRLIAASESPMSEVFLWLDRVAPYSHVPVLISGESGTGKELVARALHDKARASGKFVSVNCANLTYELMGSELFGHMAGSFTGADGSKAGLIEEAANGTLFLDEIGEMDRRLQARLLRVVNGDYSESRRVGSNQSTPVAARIVVATNKIPQKLIEEGTLRADLFYRLSLASLAIPPLRERRGDIPLLIEHFLYRAQVEFQKTVDLSRAEIDDLTAKDWPGNVRELENAIRRKVIEGDKPAQQFVEPSAALVFPPALKNDGNGHSPLSLKEYLKIAERE